MNVTQELAQRMLEAIEKAKSETRYIRGTNTLTKKVLVGYCLPNRRQWWKMYGDKAKSLGIRGPNPLEAAKILTPELLEPIYDYVPDEPLVEAFLEAKRRGLTGVRIEKSHWLRKIASGEMPPENNL